MSANRYRICATDGNLLDIHFVGSKGIDSITDDKPVLINVVGKKSQVKATLDARRTVLICTGDNPYFSWVYIDYNNPLQRRRANKLALVEQKDPIFDVGQDELCTFPLIITPISKPVFLDNNGNVLDVIRFAVLQVATPDDPEPVSLCIEQLRKNGCHEIAKRVECSATDWYSPPKIREVPKLVVPLGEKEARIGYVDNRILTLMNGRVVRSGWKNYGGLSGSFFARVTVFGTMNSLLRLSSNRFDVGMAIGVDNQGMNDYIIGNCVSQRAESTPRMINRDMADGYAIDMSLTGRANQCTIIPSSLWDSRMDDAVSFEASIVSGSNQKDISFFSDALNIGQYRDWQKETYGSVITMHH